MQTVSLEPQQWVAVINMLAEQPFRISAPIILAIQQQLAALSATPRLVADNQETPAA